MKMLFLIMITTMTMTMFVLSCSKDNDKTTNTLTLVKTVRGGCSSNAKQFTSDTVYTTKITDTISVNVALNLGCCSKFVDSINITKNIITVYIADTNSSAITCNCICNHNYDFIFAHYKPMTMSYIIKLKSYNDQNYTIYKQGILN